jgi:hypothetical protein
MKLSHSYTAEVKSREFDGRNHRLHDYATTLASAPTQTWGLTIGSLVDGAVCLTPATHGYSINS